MGDRMENYQSRILTYPSIALEDQALSATILLCMTIRIQTVLLQDYQISQMLTMVASSQ